MSGHFEQKATSDLSQAQLVARYSRSGYALGSAMYLGQQSFEKWLKAVVLRLYEEVDRGIGTSILGSFGHQLYPHIYRLYAGHIAGIGLPPVPSGDLLASYINAAPGPDAARDENAARFMARAWKVWLGDPSWKSRTWKSHMGFQVEEDVLDILNSQQKEHISSILSLTGRSGMALPQISNRTLEAPLLSRKTLDYAAISKCRADHMALAENLAERALFARHFRECQAFLSDGARSRLGDDFPYGKFLRRLVMEFGFQILISHAPHYIPLFLHNSTGRYPDRLGRDITDDLYESHADHVLFCVLVDIPYRVGQLRVNSGRLAWMLKEGHRLGHW